MAYRKIRNKDVNGNTISAETSAESVILANGTTAESQITANDGRLTMMEGKVAALEEHAPTDYCVAAYDKEQLAPEPLSVKGSKDFALAWFPWLVDMTDNAGDAVTRAYTLKKNNWFRRAANGAFAPAVCVTAEDWAQCDQELYYDEGVQLKYCDAGQFDAEKFYNEHGILQKLFNKYGQEITHIRRPWETTNKDFSNFVGRKDTIRLCDNQVGNSGKVLKGVFGSTNNYDGCNFGQFVLPPTGISPTAVCTVGNKTRSFFYLMEGETNCANGEGTSGAKIFLADNRSFPRISDMQQINNMNWSRANNADVNSPVPFAEGGYFAYNAFMTCMEIGFGTKYLHDADMFSSGISSNDSCNSLETWLKYGGVRLRKVGSSTWSYNNWSSATELCDKADGKANNLSMALNYYRPKIAVNEMQIAASYAVEMGIPEGQEFTMYGCTYWWKSIPGIKSLAEGEMNVRMYKKVIGKVSAYDKAKQPAEFEVECVLRVGLMEGVACSGDVWVYRGGGAEQVGHADHEGGGYGFSIDLYLQPQQKLWKKITTYSISDKEKFGFEEDYLFLQRTTNQGDSWTLSRCANAAYPEKKGGSSNRGECFYAYVYNYWSSVAGISVRIGYRFGGSAHHGICAPRSLVAGSSAVSAATNIAGSAQVVLGAPECNGVQP